MQSQEGPSAGQVGALVFVLRGLCHCYVGGVPRAPWCWEQTGGPATGKLDELEERQVLGALSGLCRVGG